MVPGPNGECLTARRLKQANDRTATQMPMGEPGNKIEARVTHLQMNTPKLRSVPVPSRPTLAVMKAGNIPPEFYAFLYELVGKDCHWEDRRHMAPETLQSAINNDATDIRILYADGCPAGFFELDLAGMPEEVELLYFGLSAGYRGLGLGKWFMSAAINAAWSHKPGKVVLQTNTLDHPAALSLYQKLGFEPVATETVEITRWD